MHSTAERGEATRRRRASPGKAESRRGKKEKEREKPAGGGTEAAVQRATRARRKNEGGVGGWWMPRGEEGRGGGVEQIKEREVRERTFGTSSRTKSNFGPMAKLSYFPRNMHARGRAQVFRRRFSASYPAGGPSLRRDIP